jgi:hypothetical protein
MANYNKYTGINFKTWKKIKANSDLKIIKLFENGSDINFNTFKKIETIGEFKIKKCFFSPKGKNTIILNDIVTVKGFFIFKTIEFKDGYEWILLNDFKNFTKVKKNLDLIYNLIINSGNKERWGETSAYPDRNMYSIFIPKESKRDNKKLDEIIYHFILPLISMMKFLGYLNFTTDEKTKTTYYFIITKIVKYK